MIAICTVCRRENGVRCPHCGGAAHESSPEIRNEPHGPVIAALYTCNDAICPRRRNPFIKEAGGITHIRHQQCPPTNRLELQHTPPEDQANTGTPAHALTAAVSTPTAPIEEVTALKLLLESDDELWNRFLSDLATLAVASLHRLRASKPTKPLDNFQDDEPRGGES